MERWTSGGGAGAHDFLLRPPLLPRGPRFLEGPPLTPAWTWRGAHLGPGVHTPRLYLPALPRESGETDEPQGQRLRRSVRWNRGCSPCASTPGPHARSVEQTRRARRCGLRGGSEARVPGQLCRRAARIGRAPLSAGRRGPGAHGWGRRGAIEPGFERVFSVVPSATLLKGQVSKLYGGGSFSGPSSRMPPSESCRLPGSPTLERPATKATVH